MDEHETHLDDPCQTNSTDGGCTGKVGRKQPPNDLHTIHLPIITRGLPLALCFPFERPPQSENLYCEGEICDRPKKGDYKGCRPVIVGHWREMVEKMKALPGRGHGIDKAIS